MAPYAKLISNKAEIFFETGEQWARQNLRIKVNTTRTQNVTIQADDEQFSATGSGESNKIIFERAFSPPRKKFSITFKYDGGDGKLAPSKLKSGGPYNIGTYRMLVVVAENGDDSDYNDVVAEFSGHAAK
ncbi:hypothetical protein PLICBS_010148 [Purpureocillium lilacinum]|uniref:uncharacterized protein n=1 Tax=Purpureocillium lilacinum TaxID=33203 RepID=UPI00208AF925|nr:hypothetical protein PLICBS_010148 [Purpureocillium lilacinum]